jgi:drug/metabolite transporter (DMT)-like permease
VADSIGAVPQQRASTLAIWSALGIVYLVWGSTYLAIAIVVQTLPPLLSAGIRFLAAGLVLVAWIVARRGVRAFRPTRDQLVAAGTVGLLLLVGGNGLVVLAERTVPSGLTALMVASTPLWIILLRRITGDRLPLSTAIGVVVGFGGVAFLVIPRGASGQLDPLGVLMLMGATLCWASGTFLSPRLRLPSDALTNTGLQQLTGGVALLALGLLSGEAGHIDPATFSTRSIVALVYLVVFGSLVAFTAYGWLLQHAPVSLVATYAYVNPVVAVILGFLILAEPITPSIVIGAAIIVGSVAYIVSREGARQRAARAATARPPAVTAAD